MQRNILMHPSSSSAVIHRRSQTPSLPSILILTTAPDSLPPPPMARGLFLNYSCVPVGNHISSHCGEYRLPTRKRRTSDAPRNQVRVACSAGSCHGRLRRNHASHIKIRPCVYYIPPCFFFSFFSFLRPSFCHAELIRQHFLWVV